MSLQLHLCRIVEFYVSQLFATTAATSDGGGPRDCASLIGFCNKSMEPNPAQPSPSKLQIIGLLDFLMVFWILLVFIRFSKVFVGFCNKSMEPNTAQPSPRKLQIIGILEFLMVFWILLDFI